MCKDKLMLGKAVTVSSGSKALVLPSNWESVGGGLLVITFRLMVMSILRSYPEYCLAQGLSFSSCSFKMPKLALRSAHGLSFSHCKDVNDRRL